MSLRSDLVDGPEPAGPSAVVGGMSVREQHTAPANLAGSWNRPRCLSRLAILPSAILLCSVLLIATAGAAIAFASLGSGDLFRYTQSESLGLPAPILTTSDVDSAVMQIPAPVAANARTQALGARCIARGSGPLRDPWTCMITYRSGVEAHYIIEVNGDGSFTGAGTGLVNGCCVRLPRGSWSASAGIP